MKIQSPWMGRVKGSAGNMTGSKVYDKNVLRAKAFEVSNPNTAAQQTERNFFAQVTNLIASVSEENLRSLFPSKPKSMSRRNALTKQIMAHYENNGTEKYIDFSTIHTLGNAKVHDLPKVDINITNREVEFDWSLNNDQTPIIGSNCAMIVAINADKNEIAFFADGSNIIASFMTQNLPSNWAGSDDITAILLAAKEKASEDVTISSFSQLSVQYRPKD